MKNKLNFSFTDVTILKVVTLVVVFIFLLCNKVVSMNSMFFILHPIYPGLLFVVCLDGYYKNANLFFDKKEK